MNTFIFVRLLRTVNATVLSFGQRSLSCSLIGYLRIDFAFRFWRYKWGTYNCNNSIINWFCNYPIFVNWVRLFEYIFKVIRGPLFIWFTAWIKLFCFVCDLMKIRSRFLFAIWYFNGLNYLKVTFCVIGEKARLGNCLLDFIIQK